MRAVVTGAAGQLGLDVSEVFSERGEVIALSREMCDVADFDSVMQSVGLSAAEVVINCAAWTDVDGCELDVQRAFAVNALGARHVALAASEIGALAIQISTDYVFAGEPPLDSASGYTEWDATSPISVYGRSKLAGEAEVRDVASDWLILRTAWLCGARGQNFVKTMLARASAGEAVSVVDDQVGSPTFTRDLAGLIRELAVRRVRGVIHATNSGRASWFEFARAVYELSGADPALVSPAKSAELDRPAARPAFSVLDNAVLRNDGPRLLRPWQDGLKDLLVELDALAAEERT